MHRVGAAAILPGNAGLWNASTSQLHQVPTFHPINTANSRWRLHHAVVPEDIGTLNFSSLSAAPAPQIVMDSLLARPYWSFIGAEPDLARPDQWQYDQPGRFLNVAKLPNLQWGFQPANETTLAFAEGKAALCCMMHVPWLTIAETILFFRECQPRPT